MCSGKLLFMWHAHVDENQHFLPFKFEQLTSKATGKPLLCLGSSLQDLNDESCEVSQVLPTKLGLGHTEDPCQPHPEQKIDNIIKLK